ncbi:glycosyl transferase family 2 [Thiosulfativibrio zosterae]|uniref:Glycosyl transferase family 2 n=2 Tax=Thiosulfativibrio zosterae TaxID=2675053 RepID=A0A6F8PQU2_9GAMM|nr:glycosyl transferase family 2 [Thiosulfativibrio zosterae]
MDDVMKPKITVQILTFNEEKHLARCIDSVASFASQVVVIDSFSTDRTVEIAKEKGALVLQNKWLNNYAHQFNWGLDNANIESDWIMRLDADEYITPELAEEIVNKLPGLVDSVSGIYMRRRIFFLGQWMKRSGTYPMWVLRLWRNGHGRCENRWMDEHILLSQGESTRFEHDLVDDNLNDLTWWTNKHNHYATREAADLLNHKYHFTPFDERDESDGEQAMFKRWLKEKVYANIPLFVRPFIYFLYRYFIRLGFLDGRRGFMWNILQGFWYRFLVDSKMFEAEEIIKHASNKKEAAQDLVEDQWGLKPPTKTANKG